MAAQKGRAFVLKIGDGATSEAFTTIGGMRSTSLNLAGEPVDVTDKDSAGWRELLADAGVKRVSVSGSGVFKDTASEGTARTAAVAQTINNFQIVFEDGDKFAGAFQIVTLEYNGEYNGARQYSMTLGSSGAVTRWLALDSQPRAGSNSRGVWSAGIQPAQS